MVTQILFLFLIIGMGYNTDFCSESFFKRKYISMHLNLKSKYLHYPDQGPKRWLTNFHQL